MADTAAGGAATWNAASPGTGGGFEVAGGEREWRFPRDHGAHPAYATEWWYTTGIVETPGGRRFGYELTFFRVGVAPPPAAPGTVRAASAAARRAAIGPGAALGRPDAPESRSPWRARDLILAHATITDVAARGFAVDSRASRAALGWAGADTAGLDVWVDEWRMSQGPDGFHLAVPASTTKGGFGLDLSLAGRRPPVLHGEGGLSRKDAGPRPHASWYLSLPRLETRGVLTVGGDTFDVTGTTWMDHEFFSGGLSPSQRGWDWFSARLDDGRDVMLYRLRGRGGATDYVAGTVVSSGGAASRPLDISGAVFEPLSSWKSPAGGAVYPITWRVRLPAEGLELESRTPVPQQEVRTGDAAFTYWEGLVDYAGNWNGEAVTGEGYVEMTGYEAPLELP